MSAFRPTSYKIAASVGFTLVYIVAAFVRILSASVFTRSFNIFQPPGSFLLMLANWLVLAAVLYIAAALIFFKGRLSGFPLKRGDVLISVTVLGLLVSHLYFEMPRFLASFFPSLVSGGGVESVLLIVTAELLLSYILLSLLMYLMEQLKKS